MLVILKQRYETDYILYRSLMKMGNIYLSSYGNNQNVISPGAPSREREIDSKLSNLYPWASRV